MREERSYLEGQKAAIYRGEPGHRAEGIQADGWPGYKPWKRAESERPSQPRNDSIQ